MAASTTRKASGDGPGHPDAAPPAADPPKAAEPAPTTVRQTRTDQPDAAPLAPPPSADPPPTAAPAPTTVPPMLAGRVAGEQFLGFVDDAGQPIAPDDLFDLSGSGTVVTARVRANMRVRRPGVSVELVSLAFTPGTDMLRGQADAMVAAARQASGAASEE